MDGILFNPTEEPMRPVCGGRNYDLPPGKKIAVTGSVANHIINEYERRGIVLLMYGDDTRKQDGTEMTIEEFKAEEGRKRNLDFKREQVLKINQINEARKLEGKGFLKPSKEVERYSEDLGITLLSPYDTPDKKNFEVSRLREENKHLGKKLEEQSTQIERLLQALEDKLNPKEAKKAPEEFKNDELVAKFINQKKDDLKVWVRNNEREIMTWPEEVKSRLRTKYTRFYGGNLRI